MKVPWCLLILSSLLSSCRATNITAGPSSIVNDVDFARRVSRCAELSARALFNPANDLTIVGSSDSPRSRAIIQELPKTNFAGRSFKIFTDFPETTINPNLLMRDASFLVIDEAANLRRLMAESSADRWAEYIIVVQETTDWLAEFADHLSSLGFTNVAFVSFTAQGRSTLVYPVKDSKLPIKSSSNTVVSIFDICAASQPRNLTIRPFSSLDSDEVSRGTVSFARMLESTENADEFETIKDGKPTSFGTDVLRLLTTQHNLDLVKYEWPNQTSSTWTEAMLRCVDGEFDYFYAVLPPSRHFERDDIETVAWYKYEFITFVDTPKEPTVELTDILIPYHGSVWFCTFGLFGAFAGFAWAIDRLWQRGLIRERITVLTIWSIFVDHSLPALPVKFGLRFVLGLWILHNILRNAGYTALFSSALTATDDTNMIKTFSDIWQSGRPICGSLRIKQLLNDSSDPVIYEIYNRYEVIQPSGVTDAVFNHNCIGTHHLSFIRRYNMLNRADKSRLLYAPPEAVIIAYPSFYYARKRNRYNQELKKIVTRAHETGIVSWIEQKYLLRMDQSIGQMLVTTEDPNLRLTHLLIAIELLLVGHFVSLVVFIIEIYAHKDDPLERFSERKL